MQEASICLTSVADTHSFLGRIELQKESGDQESRCLSLAACSVNRASPLYTVCRILGLESYPHRIEYNGRLISVSICPMGIHPEAFEITPGVT